MLNIMTDMKDRKGLDQNKWYEAIVVANDDRGHPDGLMLGRIQARIEVIFDGIEDSSLPWAIPVWVHPDGASSMSGMFDVPKVGTKVLLRFQDANAAFPMYRGFHCDGTTHLQEVEHNYPDRKVVRFQNSALMVIDTKDNTVYLRNPGNVKIYVGGSVELHVAGDLNQKVDGKYALEVGGSFSVKAGNLALDGSSLNLNSGGAQSAEFTDWPGIRGGETG